jgi:hypothetical protein
MYRTPSPALSIKSALSKSTNRVKPVDDDSVFEQIPPRFVSPSPNFAAKQGAGSESASPASQRPVFHSPAAVTASREGNRVTPVAAHQSSPPHPSPILHYPQYQTSHSILLQDQQDRQTSLSLLKQDRQTSHSILHQQQAPKSILQQEQQALTTIPEHHTPKSTLQLGQQAPQSILKQDQSVSQDSSNPSSCDTIQSGHIPDHDPYPDPLVSVEKEPQSVRPQSGDKPTVSFAP